MTGQSPRGRPRVPIVVWWLFAAFVAVVLAALAYGIPHFDSDLTERSAAALRDAGFPVSVHFDGRHGYLEGSLEYEEDVAAAIAVVRQVRGVADVSSTVRFLVAGGPPRDETSPPPAVMTGPELTFLVEGEVIVMRGAVGTQAEYEAIIGAAVAAFGADAVSDRLTVVDGLGSPQWVGRLPSIMPALAGAGSVLVAFGAEGASLSGSVPADALRTAVGDAVAEAVAPLDVSNRIEVVVPSEATLVAERVEGATVVRGRMPDREAAEQVLTVAREVFGAGVADELEIRPGVRPVPWLDELPRVFAASSELEPLRIEITDGVLTVFGRGPADGSVDVAITALQAIEGLVLGGIDVEVGAGAVAGALTALLEGSATFRSGSSVLSADATELLDQAAELLRANPSTRLVVEGHTDDQGSEEDNLALSRARAEAVVDYLVSAGVAPDRLTAVGYGETRPVASNDTAEGRAQNRRIEFVVEEGSA